jgi:hypothetical protein
MQLSSRYRLAATAPVSTGRQARYHFADGAGQGLADSSDQGHDGVLGSAEGADTNDSTWVAAGPMRFGVAVSLANDRDLMSHDFREANLDWLEAYADDPELSVEGDAS